MKTIQFTGTVGQLDDLTQNLTDDYLDLMSEIRVYIIDTFNVREKDYDSMTDKEFMNLAEEEGNVYSLEGFQKAFNNLDVSTEIDVIRFINVPLNN